MKTLISVTKQDISPKLQEILESSNNPFQLLKELGNIGLKTAKNSSKYILVFILLFFLAIIIGTYVLVNKDVKTITNISLLIMMYVMGGIFIFVSLYKLYIALRIEMAQFVYLQSRSLIEKISYKIITKVEEKTSGIISLSEIKKIIYSLTSIFPKILGKILVFVLEKIPITKILLEIFELHYFRGYSTPRKNNFNTTNERASFLHNKIDAFAINFFDKAKNSNWFFKTLILNILVQGVLLFLIIYF